MFSSAPSSSLESILSSTRENMQQLLHLLKNEAELLKNNNIDDLQAITFRKITLTEQIEDNEKQRIRFLTQSSFDPAEPAQWLQNNNLVSIWKEIKTLSEQAQKQNEINGLVINTSRRRIQSQLDIINSSPSVELVYSSSGESVNQRDSKTLAHV